MPARSKHPFGAFLLSVALTAFATNVSAQPSAASDATHTLVDSFGMRNPKRRAPPLQQICLQRNPIREVFFGRWRARIYTGAMSLPVLCARVARVTLVSSYPMRCSFRQATIRASAILLSLCCTAALAGPPGKTMRSFGAAGMKICSVKTKSQ